MKFSNYVSHLVSWLLCSSCFPHLTWVSGCCNKAKLPVWLFCKKSTCCTVGVLSFLSLTTCTFCSRTWMERIGLESSTSEVMLKFLKFLRQQTELQKFLKRPYLACLPGIRRIKLMMHLYKNYCKKFNLLCRSRLHANQYFVLGLRCLELYSSIMWSYIQDTI